MALWTLAIIAIVVVGGAATGRALFAGEREERRAHERQRQTLDIAAMFAPGIAAAVAEPRALLAWQPLAETTRKLFPDAFRELDAAAGGRFPFTSEQLQAAHSQWTADWLAWEHAHTNEYKLKAAVAEAELAATGGSSVARARVEAVEREKLELYQRHYSEYIRIAKALQALIH